MNKAGRPSLLRRKWSRAEGCGLLAFASAITLGIVDLRLATVPLTLLLMLCAVAPFLPRAGFFFPVVHRGGTGGPWVAITFDDGPDPRTTPRLLDLLASYGVPAAFFVTGRRVARHPELVRTIAARGHEVGNHAFDHDDFRMFWRSRSLTVQITATQRVLRELGIVPLAFRPPVGITTPPMGRVVTHLGLDVITFSCRAFDRGNRRIHGLAASILRRLRPDDIVLLHDAPPPGPPTVDMWLAEVEAILQGLTAQGLTAVPLSRLIDRPVMGQK